MMRAPQTTRQGLKQMIRSNILISRIRRADVVAFGVAALAAGVLAGTVQASPGVGVSTSSTIGHAILTDDSGKTLYRYTNDQGSSSTCYDGCAIAWPPVLVDSVPAVADPGLAQGLGTTSRNDGSLQL